MNSTLRKLFCAGLFLASPWINAAVFLGILEEAPQPPDSATLETNVRLAFRKDGSAWHPICESKGRPPWRTACKWDATDAARDWTLLDKGRALGVVKTAGWVSEARYAAEGLLRLDSFPPRKPGQRTSDYAGWPGRNVKRPLVAITSGSPIASTWKEMPSAASDKALVFSEFKRLVPQIPTCTHVSDGKVIRHPSATRMSDVEGIRTLHASDGRKLIGLRVARRLLKDCDGWAGSASDAWFYVARSGSVKPLPGWRDDSWPEFRMPIDIADFDGDGQEEAMFWFSGYNEDGYLLFDQDFTRVVRFTWGYH
jgi:hypothetical protein